MNYRLNFYHVEHQGNIILIMLKLGIYILRGECMLVHRIINMIFGILLVIYTFYSIFMKDGSDIQIITLLVIVLVLSVIIDKKKVDKS